MVVDTMSRYNGEGEEGKERYKGKIAWIDHYEFRAVFSS